MILKLSNDKIRGKGSYLPPITPRITWWGKCVAMNTLEMQTLIWINQKRLQRNDQVSLRWKNRHKCKMQRNLIAHKNHGLCHRWPFSEESSDIHHDSRVLFFPKCCFHVFHRILNALTVVFAFINAFISVISWDFNKCYCKRKPIWHPNNYFNGVG